MYWYLLLLPTQHDQVGILYLHAESRLEKRVAGAPRAGAGISSQVCGPGSTLHPPGPSTAAADSRGLSSRSFYPSDWPSPNPQSVSIISISNRQIAYFVLGSDVLYYMVGVAVWCGAAARSTLFLRRGRIFLVPGFTSRFSSGPHFHSPLLIFACSLHSTLSCATPVHACCSFIIRPLVQEPLLPGPAECSSIPAFCKHASHCLLARWLPWPLSSVDDP